ncbi:unnamed protein product [Peronospora destructor]|uniref:RanBP2-type domain-containing protein n=1 Tax=Peronospora destructor TaxID=86335 RepID=A0AAV0U2V5_9STRA|nr:unnamed protein product [Peronospora destructor]
MATSRNSSEPRDRTPGSHSHVRQLSGRSKTPVLRRESSRKSRSRSSPSSEKRGYKKQKTHSKKCHPKHKKEQMKEAEDNRLLFHSVEGGEGKKCEGLPVETAPVDAKSFFEQLQKQEAAKKPVGTVHSRGLPTPMSATMISTLDKWECSKAGCGHMNFKHAAACNKCKAMKRMTEWR